MSGELSIPELSLVVLIGVSGSGKSTFARTHFRGTEVISSDLARAHDVLPVVIVLDVPESLCVQRNAGRTDRDFGADVIRRQRAQLRRGLRSLKREGFRTVHVREYLRISYGPDYTEPANTERLRQRNLGHKRSLALREYALGLESLDRAVRGEPLWRIHECVFAVLALESEPVDPRL